jgi:hypothetical protein
VCSAIAVVVGMPRSKRVKKKLIKPKKEKSFNPEEPKQCCICLDTITVIGILPVCDHNFCYECIFEWSKSTNTCPLCKERFRCIKRINMSGDACSPPRCVRVTDKDQSSHFDDVELEQFNDSDFDSSSNDDERDETFINDSSSSYNSDDDEWALPQDYIFRRRLAIKANITSTPSTSSHTTTTSNYHTNITIGSNDYRTRSSYTTTNSTDSSSSNSTNYATRSSTSNSRIDHASTSYSTYTTRSITNSRGNSTNYATSDSVDFTNNSTDSPHCDDIRVIPQTPSSEDEANDSIIKPVRRSSSRKLFPHDDVPLDILIANDSPLVCTKRKSRPLLPSPSSPGNDEDDNGDLLASSNWLSSRQKPSVNTQRVKRRRRKIF